MFDLKRFEILLARAIAYSSNRDHGFGATELQSCAQILEQEGLSVGDILCQPKAKMMAQPLTQNSVQKTLDEIQRSFHELNDWEQEFFESIKDQLRKRGKISPKQEEVLYRIRNDLDGRHVNDERR